MSEANYLKKAYEKLIEKNRELQEMNEKNNEEI